MAPVNPTLDEGSSVTFSAIPSGGTPGHFGYYYQWKVNGVSVGAFTSSYTFTGDSTTLLASPDTVSVSVEGFCTDSGNQFDIHSGYRKSSA